VITAGFVKLRRGLLDHMPALSDAQSKLFMFALMRAKNSGKGKGSFSGTYREIAAQIGWSKSKLERVVSSLAGYIAVSKAANQYENTTFTVLNFEESAVPPVGQQPAKVGQQISENGTALAESGTAQPKNGTALAKSGTALAATDSKQKACGPLRGIERKGEVLRGERLRLSSARAKERSPSAILKLPEPERKAFGEFKNVFLSIQEHERLVEKLGHETTAVYIEAVDAWIAESPNARHSGTKRKERQAYPTILNWHRRDLAEGRTRTPKPQQEHQNVRPLSAIERRRLESFSNIDRALHGGAND
jgi:hypothetical protein